MTGGHAATTALSVIKYIKEKNSGWEIVWVGSKYAFEGSRKPSFEAINFPKQNVKFIHINTGKLQTKFTRHTISSLAKVPTGFVHALKILSKENPDIVISFGGFAGFPLVVAARLMQIPVLIHEQTAAVGRANQYSNRFANKITLARPGSKKYFDAEKCVVVGNPISKEIARLKPKTKKTNPPTIFVTGGSRGSQSLNEAVWESLNTLTQKYNIIHVVGVTGIDKYKKSQNSRYKVYPTVDPKQMAELYKRADILLARSGANTVSEAMQIGIPSIFVPLPISYLNEQYLNARMAQNAGIAKIINQSDLNPGNLVNAVNQVNNSWDKMVSSYKRPFDDAKAAEKLFDVIQQTL